jgi:hypothetical protein
MNADRKIVSLKRCLVCEAPHVRRGGTCSRRECRAIVAEFHDFSMLQFILGTARWAGAPSQEEMAREYFRQRMWDGIRRLPHSADLLGEVLAEILEEAQESVP